MQTADEEIIEIAKNRCYDFTASRKVMKNRLSGEGAELHSPVVSASASLLHAPYQRCTDCHLDEATSYASILKMKYQDAIATLQRQNMLLPIDLKTIEDVDCNP